jgi:UDP-2-acetamido-3-amino-2,3-dideoxy-glucuronate N-acetyltransferase
MTEHIRIKTIADRRGVLCMPEPPFKVERAFYIFGVPHSETRGCHAHKEQHQFLIMLAGVCHYFAKDERDSVGGQLWNPTIGLHVPPGTYLVLSEFTPNAVLLALTQGKYDPEDYIR